MVRSDTSSSDADSSSSDYQLAREVDGVVEHDKNRAIDPVIRRIPALPESAGGLIHIRDRYSSEFPETVWRSLNNRTVYLLNALTWSLEKLLTCAENIIENWEEVRTCEDVTPQFKIVRSGLYLYLIYCNLDEIRDVIDRMIASDMKDEALPHPDATEASAQANAATTAEAAEVTEDQPDTFSPGCH